MTLRRRGAYGARATAHKGADQRAQWRAIRGMARDYAIGMGSFVIVIEGLNAPLPVRLALGLGLGILAVSALLVFRHLPAARLFGWQGASIQVVIAFVPLAAGIAFTSSIFSLFQISFTQQSLRIVILAGILAGFILLSLPLTRIAQRHVRTELQAGAHDDPLSTYLAVAALALPSEIGGERTDDERADLPRVTAIRSRGAYEVRLRSDLPADLRTELLALVAADVYANQASVMTILARDTPCDHVIARMAYTFPDTLDPHGFPDVVRIKPDDMTLLLQFDPEFELGEKVVFAAVTDGRVAASCTSAHDETLLGDEAYLYTQPEYHGRGFGRQVALAWADYMQRRGAIPFFAYDPEGPEGKACAALAHSLRLIPLCEVVAYY